LERSQVPDLPDHLHRLSQATHELPRVLEIRYRHRVAQDDDFCMLPGFANFVSVARGTKLAEDRRGEISAPEDAMLMLPLYQGQGDDGFFLARPVSPVWLGVSAVLRQARFDRLLRLLPGVSPHPTADDEWVVSTAAGAAFITDVFHLFGYRRVRDRARSL